MAYFDYFTNSLATDDILDTDEIRGTCDSLCPKEEAEIRQRERMVHVLEVLGSSRTLVKSYSRSAADSNMAKPHLLRPYTVLKKTVEHLLFDVIRRKDVPIAIMYDFINDRLRAVRQDMTIQRLDAEKFAELLEPMIRFYVYFGYKLSDAPGYDFDTVLNKKYLLECLKLYLTCCNKSGYGTDCLGDMFSNLKLNKMYETKNDRVLIESLYILCNLDDISPILRYLTLDKELRRHPLLLKSYKIAIANMEGHFVQAVRLADQLCPLTYYAFCVHLPVLQRRALRTLSHAYHSSQLSVSLSAVRRWLLFDSERQAKDACTHYGLSCKGDRVHFRKGSFKEDVAVMRMKHIGSKDKHDLPIVELLSY